MADLSLEISINAGKKSAETFGEQIAEGMKKAMGKLGLGSMMGGVQNAAGGAGIEEGVAAGMVAGGVVGALMAIVGFLKDMPVITSIMKLLKLILTLMFLPAMPFFVLAMKGLARFASDLAPGMILGMKQMQEGIDQFGSQMKKAGKDLYSALWNGWSQLIDAGKDIWSQIFMPVWNVLKNIGAQLGNILIDIYNALITGYNKIASFIGASKLSTISKSGGSSSSQLYMTTKAGVVPVSGSSGNALTNLLTPNIPKAFMQLGGVIGENGMFGLHRGERILSATEREQKSGNNFNINITISSPQIRKDDDVKLMVKELDHYLKQELRRRISYV